MEIIGLICEKVSVARRGCSGKSVGIWVVQLRVTWKAARVVWIIAALHWLLCAGTTHYWTLLTWLAWTRGHWLWSRAWNKEGP